MKQIKVGSDFSGVGAFDFAMKRIAQQKALNVKSIFACDMDKYARISYLANHDAPEYYPLNVYDREIPKESIDIYMTSPPCQAFSLAGKRLGKDDEKGRGILFFNSHEFIKQNKPRYFIFENVKGLLSDDGGKTFNEWITLLSGKSVNGTSVFFPHEDSVPYHVHYAVMNAKNYGVPQNRERIFIIGIRDDEDNDFTFPAEVPLEKKLKDVLEENVDEKYFLSEKMVAGLMSTNHLDSDRINNTIRASGHSSTSKKHSFDVVKVGHINQDTQASAVYSEEGISPTLSAGTHGYAQGYIEVGTLRTHNDGKGFKGTEDNNCPTIPARAREDGSGQPVIRIHSATSNGFEEATNEDSINFSNPHSKTRRGRVGKEVAQTLDTACNQGVMVSKEVRTEESKKKRKETGTNDFRGKKVEFREQEHMNTLTTSLTNDHYLLNKSYRIRRLTPTEVFRLMDFPDSFVENIRKEKISDSQAYKQAGNSIVVKCLELIINNLKLD
jgi:DNA (cytosine-5)-methyltransferase 1